MGKKLLYIFDETDWHSRIPLATAARDAGYDVTIGLLSDKDSIGDAHGFNLHIIKRSHAFGPFSVLEMITALRRAVRDEAPDLVHTVTLKYAFLLGLALLCLRVPRVYTLAGLGYVFRGHGVKPLLLRGLLWAPLMIVLRNARAKIIFQNPDDLELLTGKFYVRRGQSILIRGSGVDLETFKAAPLPDTDTPVVVMPTRLVHGKGIHVFANAAAILKDKGINAHFQIAGGLTHHNPEAITESEMHRLVAETGVEWLGRVEDMPALLRKASLVVYPSYYGEGIPRVLLEAAAVGRAIVTTDNPGCKETVVQGRNGLLVPVKNAQATAEAIQSLLDSPGTLQSMGQESRTLAEEHFDIHAVVAQTLKIYG